MNILHKNNYFLKLSFLSLFFQKIYLPGDNDIGGEEDNVSKRIHERFNFAYTQPDTLVLKSVTFFKVRKIKINLQSNSRV